MTKNILVIDDESSIRDMLRMALEGHSFSVTEASNATTAQTKIDQQIPDLILLDWMMPGTSGIELLRRLRKDQMHCSIPVIMLTAKDDDDHSIQGLDAGADDYITKPFSPRALLARINALLRRTGTIDVGNKAENRVTSGNIVIDIMSHKANIEGKSLELSPTEFRLLHFFISNTGRVFSRNQLLDSVWGDGVYVEDRTVDVHIRRLRKILEPFNVADYIHTVRGVGYRFEPKSA